MLQVELMQVLIDGIDLIIQMEKQLEKGQSIDRLMPASVSAASEKKKKF